MVAAVETMAYAGEVPWHGLGVKVRPDLTPEEMLNAAELNWEVEKVPLTYTRSGQWPAIDDDGTELSVPNKFALIRKTDGLFYDVVGPNWNPMQNAKALYVVTDGIPRMDFIRAQRDLTLYIYPRFERCRQRAAPKPCMVII